MESEKSRMRQENESNIYPNINPPPYDGPPPVAPQPATGPPQPKGPPLPSAPPAVQVTYISPATITVVPGMGSEPSRTRCRSCNMDIVSRIQYTSTTKTHLFALLLCLIGCWPCAFVPYCVDSCKNVDHYCPNCNAYIGTYQN